mgnify:CR=1 FL=1|jgi:AP endonuclease 1
MNFFGPKKQSTTKRSNRDVEKRQPVSFASWNVNSLGTVLEKSDTRGAFITWLKKEAPDVMTLQEVKHAAASDIRRFALSETKDREHAKAQAFKAFKSDIGTLLDGGKNGWDIWLTLAKGKGEAGQALLVKRDVEEPIRHYCFDHKAPGREKAHEDGGRVIIASFKEVTVISTYVPNNGGKQESFDRRRAWDDLVRRYLRDLVVDEERHVIWMGDLNVCTDDFDVSGDADWWTQWVMGGGFKLLPEESGNRNQAGYTRNEMDRFRNILKVAKLVDPYRLKHPVASQPSKESTECMEGPYYTWRGSESGASRYKGQGMRIDYTLVSPGLVDRVVRADILGSGTRRDGFMGSDHCPIILELMRQPSPPFLSSASSSSPIACGLMHDKKARVSP